MTEQDAEVLPKTVLLAGSRKIAWSAVRRVLEVQRELRVVGDVLTSGEALSMASTHHPDLILLAQDLGDVSSVTLIEAVHARSPASRIVVFADVMDPTTVAALDERGATGYIEWRSLDEETLLPGLMAILAGYSVCSDGVGRLSSAQPDASPLLPEVELSPLERRVLDGLIADRSEKQIAQDEVLGDRTVRQAVQRLKRKFDCRTLWGLTRTAWERGYRTRLQ